MAYKTPKFAPTGKYQTYWWSFRHLDARREISFIHSAALVDPDGHIVERENVGYCNRTWESYHGQTARNRLAGRIEKRCANLLKGNKQVQALVAELRRGHDVAPVSCDGGTLVGFSLSMHFPI